MSASDLEEFYVHSLVVEEFLGTSGYGADTFGPVTPVAGFMDGTRKLVRDADGVQVVSESTFYTDPASAALFTPNSRVTFNGAESRVIRANLNDSGSLDLPDHLAISLT